MADIPRRDPLAELTAVLGGALGSAGSEMLDALLDEQPVG